MKFQSVSYLCGLVDGLGHQKTTYSTQDSSELILIFEASSIEVKKMMYIYIAFFGG
jgi:hypothetical protein